MQVQNDAAERKNRHLAQCRAIQHYGMHLLRHVAAAAEKQSSPRTAIESAADPGENADPNLTPAATEPDPA